MKGKMAHLRRLLPPGGPSSYPYDLREIGRNGSSGPSLVWKILWAGTLVAQGVLFDPAVLPPGLKCQFPRRLEPRTVG